MQGHRFNPPYTMAKPPRALLLYHIFLLFSRGFSNLTENPQGDCAVGGIGAEILLCVYVYDDKSVSGGKNPLERFFVMRFERKGG